MSDDAPIAARSRRKRTALVLIAVGLVSVLAAMASIRTIATSPKLPDPNGFDDLVRAGSMCQGEPTSPEVFKDFLEEKREALALARLGLGRESVVHFPDTQEGLEVQIEGQLRLKDVARVLAIEGLAEQADGRFGDASRCFREAMGVGQALTQGGMLTDATLGWSLMKKNGDRLRSLRDKLSPDDLRATIRDLEALDGRRVPVKDVVDRWERWYGGAFGPVQRAIMDLNGIRKTERASQDFQARKAHDAAERTLRFLMVELAIHAFHEDRKAWPRSVRELVPAYLAKVPTDPVSGQPIAYPANASGELTDDLSQVARADGEVSAGPGVSPPPADKP